MKVVDKNGEVFEVSELEFELDEHASLTEKLTEAQSKLDEHYEEINKALNPEK